MALTGAGNDRASGDPGLLAGSLQFSLDGTARVWDVDKRQALRTQHVAGDRGEAVALTPEADAVVSADGDESVSRWDIVTGVVTMLGERQ